MSIRIHCALLKLITLFTFFSPLAKRTYLPALQVRLNANCTPICVSQLHCLVTGSLGHRLWSGFGEQGPDHANAATANYSGHMIITSPPIFQNPLKGWQTWRQRINFIEESQNNFVFYVPWPVMIYADIVWISTRKDFGFTYTWIAVCCWGDFTAFPVQQTKENLEEINRCHHWKIFP